MCGFLTWVTKEGRPWRDSELLDQKRCLEMLAHRGPDDTSQMIEDGVWQGFQRLAILDLSKKGRQPMEFGGRYSLVYNGEIFNFKGLRERLGKMEHLSSGDSVVLGSLLARFPLREVLESLRGMFAFTWWDRESKELLAARDPFGIKPLYYTTNKSGDLIVGSELRAVQGLSLEDAEVSPEALAQFLRWGAIQSPDSLISEIKCLPPGHFLRWKNGEIEIERYFVPRWPGKEQWIEDASQQRTATRGAFLQSLEAHLVADVPVGVFLSGGLDSTMIAAGMKHLGYENIQAFSIGYEGESGVPDETVAAARAAEFLGCEFVRERISADSLFDSLDSYFASLDQPSGDAMNTWLVARRASEHVKVALSGLGADEWFGGYNYMRLVALSEKVGSSTGSLQERIGPMVAKMERFLPSQFQAQQHWKAIKYATGAAGTTPLGWYDTARTIFDGAAIARLLDVNISQAENWTLGQFKLGVRIDSLATRAPDSLLNELLLLETEGYLANTLLRDNDATTMSHGLELRVPLIDSEIFDLVGTLPPSAKTGLNNGKIILRESMADLLPPWISDPKNAKKTFTLPLMKWMRTPKWRERIHDVLGSQECRERGWICPKEVRRALDEYETHGLNSTAGWKLSQRVWMLFVLESWAKLQQFGTSR